MVTHPPLKDCWAHSRKVHHWNHIKGFRCWVRKGHRCFDSKGHRFWQCCEMFQDSHSHQPSWAPWLGEGIRPLQQEENKRWVREVCSLFGVDNRNQGEAG